MRGASAVVRRPAARAGLAALGGLALAAAFPPWDVTPLIVVGPALLFLLLPPAGILARATAGFLFGAAFFGALLSWVIGVGLHGWALLTLGEAAFVAAFAVVAGPALSSPRPFLGAVGVAGLWVLVLEVARARFPLGGFPWGALGAPLVGTPFDVLAPFGGGAAVSGLVALASAGLALTLARRYRAGLMALGAAGLVVLATLPFGPPPPEGLRLRVAVVQGNVPLPAGPATSERTAQVLADHVALTRTLPRARFDLIVWPENVLDIAERRPGAGATAPEPLATLARELETWFAAGVVSGAGPGRFLNSAISVDPSGRVAGVYDKVRPVPFGEYVPGRRFLGFVGALRAVPRDMVPGDGPTLLPVPGGAVGAPVSYETAFARIVRGFAELGAEALVVPTNTSSFGPEAPAASQELQLTRMRARELGLWTIQAAPSGISAFVDPRGRVMERTGLYEAAVLTGEIRLDRSGTAFSRFGETPVILGAAAASLAGAWPGLVRTVRRRGTPIRG